MKLRYGTKDILYLTACALNGQQAELDKLSLKEGDKLFSLAHRHTIGAIVAIALENSDKYDITFTKKDKSRWSSVHGAAIKRRVLFDTERERLLKILEDKKIWYCPLKGIILQDMYPKYEMREMSDNDILFDSTKRALLRRIMLENGYKTEDHGVTNHDMFTKEPVYNFEFHTKLFMHTFSTHFNDYYENLKERLIKDKNNKFGYKMRDEDFYIYMIAHAYKHYNEGGTGIKSLCDTFIFNLRKGDTLNRDYIKTECKKLGINTFEILCRNVSDKLFSNPDKSYVNVARLNEKEREFLSYISFTGSFCTREDFIKSRIKRSGSKKAYIVSRLFPDENYYKEAHPFLYQNKIFIPAFLLCRMGKMLITNRTKIKDEIKVIFKN